MPPAMPRPRMTLSLQYMFVVSPFGLLSVLNPCRRYLRYTKYQLMDPACKKDSKYYLESVLNDALNITADIEWTTVHPYVKYQTARIL